MSKETNNVLNLILKFKSLSIADLSQTVGLSKKTLYKHLKRLEELNLIMKSGKHPHILYSTTKNTTKSTFNLLPEIELFIEKNYLHLTPDGVKLYGMSGFTQWVNKNNLQLESEAQKYYDYSLKLITQKSDYGYSLTGSILNSSKPIYLSELFCFDFYNLAHFGKTKLGALTYIAKSAQNTESLIEINSTIQEALYKLICDYKIDQVGFVPPTLKRKSQILTKLKNLLNIDLPQLKVIKVGDNLIPQKSIKKLEDRIENAQRTMYIPLSQNFEKNILLIDDAIGSGATLNEIATKIKLISPNSNIYGFAIVGSIKGFDVISEV